MLKATQKKNVSVDWRTTLVTPVNPLRLMTRNRGYSDEFYNVITTFKKTKKALDSFISFS